MHAKFLHILLIASFIFFSFLTPGEGQQNYKAVEPKRQDHPQVPRITASETTKMYKEGKLILANAHESEVYAKEHIPGSISLPNGKVQHMDIKLPPNMIIAFYCQ